MKNRSVAIALFLAMSSKVFAAPSPLGVWSRDAGATSVEVTQCGASLCGRIARLLPDSHAKVGQQVLSGMRQTGPTSWSGIAFNPEDGRRYVGKMVLSGDKLIISGCVLGGIICKRVVWTRGR